MRALLITIITILFSLSTTLSTLAQSVELEWAKSIGNHLQDGAYTMQQDPSGNLYICGKYLETVDFDPEIGVSNQTSLGSSDMFIVKLDSDGNFIWIKSIGGTEAAIMRDLV